MFLKKIAVTGRVASGKSIVSTFLSQGKFPYISADTIVHRLYREDVKLKEDVAFLFGEKAVVEEEVDRNFLKERLLEKPERLFDLEDVVFPYLTREIELFFSLHRQEKIVICEIPLLFEMGKESLFDSVVWVKAPKKTRLERFLAKGGSLPLFNLFEKRRLHEEIFISSCHVIENNSDKEILKTKSQEFLEKIINIYP